jgi:uncharacterized membrane protein YphA (DoxX/SURF4 family)
MTTSQPKWMTITGWTLTGLMTAAFIASAVMKFIQPGDMAQQIEKMGLSPAVVRNIGVVELACALLYVAPRTTVLGAILLTGYLGGAILTHVRGNEPFLGPLIFGVVVWFGVFFREPRLRALVPWRRPVPINR